MLNISTDHKSNTKEFNANYRGEVISDEDPLNAGRVKIRVFGVYDDLSDEVIPWAIYTDPFMGGQPEVGGFWVPDVGSHVWVFFEAGDHMQPVYFAGAPARPHGPSERLEGEASTYPRNKVIKTKSGHLVEIDDSPENTRIHIKHASDTHKEYQHDGSSLEEIKGNLTIYVEGDATTHVVGNVNETVEGNVVRSVKGNVTETVEGDFTTSVMGARKEQSADGSEYISSGEVDIGGSKVNLNS